jgi:hypothetical protein
MEVLGGQPGTAPGPEKNITVNAKSKYLSSRARICKSFKEPRNRFPACRSRLLGSLKVYKFGLCTSDSKRSENNSLSIIHSIF